MGAHFKIRAEKTGHYFTHGSLTQDTRYVWVCLHGYGQLARYFIHQFEFLNPGTHYVIVPEGLNRFYFEGVNERPVSNWMTREDRLDEIADFTLFLEALRKKIGWDRNPSSKIIYLGFSQGVTTLLRWLHDAGPRVDHMLLWAGGFPDDLSFARKRSYFQNIPAHYFVGDKDVYITPEIVEEKKAVVEEIGLRLQLHAFCGTHKLDEKTLRAWIMQHLEQDITSGRGIPAEVQPSGEVS